MHNSDNFPGIVKKEIPFLYRIGKAAVKQEVSIRNLVTPRP